MISLCIVVLLLCEPSIACVAMRPGDFEFPNPSTPVTVYPLTTESIPTTPTTDPATMTTTTPEPCPCQTPNVMPPEDCTNIGPKPGAPDIVMTKIWENGVCKLKVNCKTVQFHYGDGTCAEDISTTPFTCKDGQFYNEFDDVVVAMRCGTL